MGIKTVHKTLYSPDLAPGDFWLFPKLKGCRYETIEELKEALTKVIDTLTQEDFHVAFSKLLERYNKCSAVGGDYFERDECFMCVLSIKWPIRKKSGNLFNDPRVYICINEYWKHCLQLHIFPRNQWWSVFSCAIRLSMKSFTDHSNPDIFYTGGSLYFLLLRMSLFLSLARSSKSIISSISKII